MIHAPSRLRRCFLKGEVLRTRAGRNALSALSTEQMEPSLDKLRGFFFLMRSAASKIRARGSVTITSGASALKPPGEGMAILASANAADATFAHALALELAPVRVNTLTPGVVDTGVWDATRRREALGRVESPSRAALWDRR